MKAIRYLLPMVLLLGIEPAKAYLSIPEVINCNGPFRYNGYANDYSLSGSLSALAEAGILNQQSGDPSTPIYTGERATYAVNGALGVCGGSKTITKSVTDSEASEGNNCGVANAVTTVGEEVNLKCNSDKVEILFHDDFEFFGGGRLFAICCQSGTPLSGSISGLCNQDSTDGLGGEVIFVVPSSVNSVDAVVQSQLSCPSVPAGGAAYYFGTVTAKLLKMNDQSVFELVAIQEVTVASNPNSGFGVAQLLKTKVHLTTGIYKVSIVYNAKAEFGKTAFCSGPDNPNDTEFSLIGGGSVQGSVKLTVSSFN